VREYLLCLLAAAAVTYLTVPLSRKLALRWGALAEVRDRDVHDKPTPRLGGLAMFAGLAVGLLLASKLPLMSTVFVDGARIPLALLSGAAIIVLLGVIDDRWSLAAPTKFAGQVLAASVMAVQGIAIIWLPIGGTLVLDPVTSVLLTVLVVLVTINAINMVDGLDGLAAGIVGIAAIAFFAYSYLLSVEIGFERATMATLISALLAGMCLGFLPHNVFPARIFMGDTGSMLLGLLLAASIITLSGQVDPSAIEGGTLLPALLPILLPLAVMAVPLLDLALAVVRRTRRGRSPFAPDKQHMHHRLLEVGHSQRRAVLLMYGLAAVIAGTAVALAFVPVGYALLILASGMALLITAVIWPRLGQSRSADAVGDRLIG
jgi:UDP-GlcNAc:undecaprenyl-phosphate GlcNAc-1-phosphate transferase